MRKYIGFLLIFLFIGSTITYAQGYGVTAIKMGYFNPKNAKGGLIIGGMIGSAVDESVDLGIGVDFFRGSNKEETQTGESTSGAGTKETAWRLDAESSSTIIPITAQVNMKIPASYMFYYTFGGGVGYEMLWTREKEYDVNGEEIDSESRFYHGLRWILTAGILYRLGSRSSFLLEAFYDGSKLNRKKDNITYKVNPSGIGVRAGIRIGVR